MKLCIVGIGGAGGKVTQEFLGNVDLEFPLLTSITHAEYISPGTLRGIWLEADKNDAKNIQSFFGDMTEDCYSYDDGIGNVSRDPEVPLAGPNIKKGAKLYVDRLDFTGSSENYYWWDKYGFSIRAKNLNPEEYDVTFTLSTKTGNREWTTIETKAERIGQELVVVHFNETEPFRVTDAGQTFYYRVKYSEYDQGGKDSMETKGARINRKIVPYSIYNGVMVLNIFSVLFIITMIGLFMERSLKKGVEAHERSSGGAGSAKMENPAKSSRSFVDSLAKMLRRR